MSGQCGDSGGGWGKMTSAANCGSGAAALGWSASDSTAEDDGQTGATLDPLGCYFEDSLKFNNNGNTGSCSSSDTCLCTLTCPPGTYQDQEGQSSCKTCASGTYSTIGASSCPYSATTCPAGTYANGTAGCVSCGTGKYNDQTGQTSESVACKSCGAGEYQDEDGQTSCKTCASGEYSATVGATSCFGMYKERTSGHCGDSGGGWGKMTSAANCGSGAAALSWQDTTADTVSWLSFNPPGCYYRSSAYELKFNTYNSNGACTSTRKCLCTLTCPPGTYQNQTGQSTCESCPNDTYSIAGASSCPYFATTCPAGTYKNGTAACEPCDAGSITNTGTSAGATTCTVCAAGKYSLSSNVAACNDVNECDTDPCKNGLCWDSNTNNTSINLNEYKCECHDGYEGTDCETDINECANNPCQNDGNCTNNVGNYECECQDGYEGIDCETDINECANNPCQNEGICTDVVGDYVCECQGNYDGNNCTECQDGYEGTNCETDINECANNPCQNDGSCTNNVGNYECECQDGYEGTNCETAIDVNYCQNTAEKAQFETATNVTQQYQSSIGAMFAACIPPDCNPRQLEQEVHGNVTDYRAAVTTAEDAMNAATPCQNGAGCTSNVDSYTCNCVAGWEGTDCETDIDECANNPCQNGGICTNTVGGFQCACVQGVRGIECDNDIDECNPRLPFQIRLEEMERYGEGYAGEFQEVLSNLNNLEVFPDRCEYGSCVESGTDNNIEYGAYSCTCLEGWSHSGISTPCDVCADGFTNTSIVQIRDEIKKLWDAATIEYNDIDKEKASCSTLGNYTCIENIQNEYGRKRAAMRAWEEKYYQTPAGTSGYYCSFSCVQLELDYSNKCSCSGGVSTSSGCAELKNKYNEDCMCNEG